MNCQGETWNCVIYEAAAVIGCIYIWFIVALTACYVNMRPLQLKSVSRMLTDESIKKKITTAIRQESWRANQCILSAKNSLGYCLNHCHSLLSVIIQHEYKGLWWLTLMGLRLENHIVLILFWYIALCFSVSQTTKIRHPTQHFIMHFILQQFTRQVHFRMFC